MNAPFQNPPTINILGSIYTISGIILMHTINVRGTMGALFLAKVFLISTLILGTVCVHLLLGPFFLLLQGPSDWCNYFGNTMCVVLLWGELSAQQNYYLVAGNIVRLGHSFSQGPFLLGTVIIRATISTMYWTPLQLGAFCVYCQGFCLFTIMLGALSV